MTIQLTGNLVDGKIVDRGTDDPIEVRDPADLRIVVGQVPAMGPAEIELVFAAAERGAIAWRATGHIARGEVLRKAALLLRADSERLARLIVHEMGKTLAEARGEVGKAAEFFEYYAAVICPVGHLRARRLRVPDGHPCQARSAHMALANTQRIHHTLGKSSPDKGVRDGNKMQPSDRRP